MRKILSVLAIALVPFSVSFAASQDSQPPDNSSNSPHPFMSQFQDNQDNGMITQDPAYNGTDDGIISNINNGQPEVDPGINADDPNQAEEQNDSSLGDTQNVSDETQVVPEQEIDDQQSVEPESQEEQPEDSTQEENQTPPQEQPEEM